MFLLYVLIAAYLITVITWPLSCPWWLCFCRCINDLLISLNISAFYYWNVSTDSERYMLTINKTKIYVIVWACVPSSFVVFLVPAVLFAVCELTKLKTSTKTNIMERINRSRYELSMLFLRIRHMLYIFSSLFSIRHI